MKKDDYQQADYPTVRRVVCILASIRRKRGNYNYVT